MLLAESVLMKGFADLLGVPVSAIEGGVITLLVMALLFLVRIILMKERTDFSQQEMSRQLVNMTSRSIESYEKNNEVLVVLKDTLKSLSEHFIEEVKSVSETLNTHNILVTREIAPLATTLQDIKKSLIKNNNTRVVVKEKASGEIIAEFSAKPVVGDDGQHYLVVEYDAKSNKQ